MANKLSKFSPKLALEIGQRLADGEGLMSICKDSHMPRRETVLKWMTNKEYKVGDMTFDQFYYRARKEQAEYYAELLNELAMDAEEDVIEYAQREDIDKRVINSLMTARKTKIDTLKWTASKLKPETYGDVIKPMGDTNIQVIVRNYEPSEKNKGAVVAGEVQAESVSIESDTGLRTRDDSGHAENTDRGSDSGAKSEVSEVGGDSFLQTRVTDFNG